jgi:hypothetical protein
MIKKVTYKQAKVRNEIIDVMIKQLGGTKFFLMTGSKPMYKDISTDSPLVALKLIKNSSGANYLILQYIRGLDLYKMEFVKMTKNNQKTIIIHHNIYGDQLQDIFTRETKLYTSL